VRLRTEVLRSRRSHWEVVAPVVGFGSFLLPDVFADHFVRYVTARGYEVAPSPELPTPIMLLQMFELLQQLPRRLPLDRLHDLAGRQVRRTRQQHVHVVARHRAFQNLDLQRPTNLSNQIPQPNSYLARQNRFTILRNPYEVVLEIETTMRTRPVTLHRPEV